MPRTVLNEMVMIPQRISGQTGTILLLQGLFLTVCD